MTDNVFSFAQMEKKHKEAEKQNLLDTVEEVRKKIEDGEITELIFACLTKDGDVDINASVKNRLSAIALLEAGKMILFRDSSTEE
jgi:hypothetical protein